MKSKHDADTSAPGTEGVRLRLLEIAEALFAELGVENTPLQRIVEESGRRDLLAAGPPAHRPDALAGALAESGLKDGASARVPT